MGFCKLLQKPVAHIYHPFWYTELQLLRQAGKALETFVALRQLRLFWWFLCLIALIMWSTQSTGTGKGTPVGVPSASSHFVMHALYIPQCQHTFCLRCTGEVWRHQSDGSRSEAHLICPLCLTRHYFKDQQAMSTDARHVSWPPTEVVSTAVLWQWSHLFRIIIATQFCM